MLSILSFCKSKVFTGTICVQIKSEVQICDDMNLMELKKAWWTIKAPIYCCPVPHRSLLLKNNLASIRHLHLGESRLVVGAR